ncbi:aminotransferase class I/II-fold pyridoxal phosphate-dependent enzyme [Bailinhaonella thermotolerans]|uniref:8-amino-7-oxononanoate synthase n=1 Tax=Bailinhaonella thermotolerans TaxID=1070861 RepID=A0A3A4BGA9_9ACTN|nr:aminotransferase class I/II-fold pyridoxal phosphate-dependent enzyme [Bailinhaonella thermotolerans]RJL33532.1 aminotransferase class I/II-fold pyridoxal phosphate-dependent enzyme [Bailinhaonella thermotolerans]
MADVFDKCRAWPDYRVAVAAGIYAYCTPLVERGDGTEVTVHGDRKVIMAGSNDYLGLSTDPRVKEAAIAAVRSLGTGCSGSRLLNGTLALHEEFEARMASFLGREAAMVGSTGFSTNLALAALLGQGDAVFADRHNHASLADAVRLSPARCLRYRHSDMDDLESLLTTTETDAARVIVTDGLFSMSGDLCDLPGIVKLAQRHNARVIVDQAHDLGLLGPNGRGVAEYFGLEPEVDLIAATLSKSFGSIGGVLAGPRDVIDYLRHQARSIIFTAALPPASIATALAALEIVRGEPERRGRVLDNAERLHNGLRALGYDTGTSATPVIPVYVRDALLCMRFWTELLQEGVFTNAVIHPATAVGNELIRVSVMATHTEEHLDRVLSAFERAGRRLGVIPARPPASFDQVRMARP